MNQEVQKKWVASLRSGNYVQGKYCLRSKEDKFCCLGVLCDLAVNQGVIPVPELDEKDGNYLYGMEKNSGNLPKEVIKWSGMEKQATETSVTYHDSFTFNKVEYRALTDLNDKVGLTFDQIADLIEKGVS